MIFLLLLQVALLFPIVWLFFLLYGEFIRVVTGVSTSLIKRAADVMLKQKRPLLICPRETPFNQIHLKNLLELSQMGVHIIPAMPGFYQNLKLFWILCTL